tara:strand:- start:121 stop:447 length:327 start_codon:yes stop_codon:yes gene_type:complete
MATKTWQVNTLQRELADGYVSKVIYRVNGEDGTYKFRATGEVDLPKPDTLIPYADLTEEVVLGWVKAKLNDQKDAEGKTIDRVAAIEAAVENGVNEQKTPTTGVGKPW